jgi:hypothetical protein
VEISQSTFRQPKEIAARELALATDSANAESFDDEILEEVLG